MHLEKNQTLGLVLLNQLYHRLVKVWRKPGAMYIFMIFSPVPRSRQCCPENGIYRIGTVRANSKRMSSRKRG